MFKFLDKIGRIILYIFIFFSIIIALHFIIIGYLELMNDGVKTETGITKFLDYIENR